MPGLEELIARIPGAATRGALQSGLGFSGLGAPSLGVAPAAGFFPFGSLGRVDDTFTPDLAGLLTRAQTEVPTFNVGALEGARAGFESGLQRALSPVAPVETGYIERDILNRRVSGLGGFSPAEMTALRDQQLQGIRAEAQDATRRANAANIASGRRGAVEMALSANIANQAAAARGNVERDLFLANIAEKQRRLGELQDFAGGLQQRKFGQQQAAATSLANFGLARESARQSALNNAFANTFATRNDLFNRQAFNLAQLGREKSGQLGVLFGFGELGTAEEARQQAAALGREQLASAERIADISGRYGVQAAAVGDTDVTNTYNFGGGGGSSGPGFSGPTERRLGLTGGGLQYNPFDHFNT